MRETKMVGLKVVRVGGRMRPREGSSPVNAHAWSYMRFDRDGTFDVSWHVHPFRDCSYNAIECQHVSNPVNHTSVYRDKTISEEELWSVGGI